MTPAVDGGWRADMDAAPRNGTDIVGHDSRTGTSHVTSWSPYGWHDPDNHYYSEADDFNPDFWMPLPSPPASEAL
jgi:hypothetical protein